MRRQRRPCIVVEKLRPQGRRSSHLYPFAPDSRCDKHESLFAHPDKFAQFSLQLASPTLRVPEPDDWQLCNPRLLLYLFLILLLFLFWLLILFRPTTPTTLCAGCR